MGISETARHDIPDTEINLAQVKETISFIDTLDDIIEQIGKEYDDLSKHVAQDRPADADECLQTLKLLSNDIFERFKTLSRVKELFEKYHLPLANLLNRQKDLDKIYKAHGLKD